MAIRVLITGAAGYVGLRLLPLLAAKQGVVLRVLVKDAQLLPALDPAIEVIEGDLLDLDTACRAVQGIEVIYDLTHGMAADGSDFCDREVLSASHLTEAARQAGVKRIIYLSSLGCEGKAPSPQLRTLHLVGEVLRCSGVPVTEFRTGPVIGKGTYGFEILRRWVERLPLLLAYSWGRARLQPIAIADLLHYLEAGLSLPASTGKILEVGGQDILSLQEMMQGYAQLRGLKRFFIPALWSLPWAVSLWLSLVTRIPVRVVRAWIDQVRCEALVTQPLARELFAFEPMSYRDAVQAALSECDPPSSLSGR
ncbi:MAG: NAD(P)H-binding protein [Chlamydiia bacterium]